MSVPAKKWVDEPLSREMVPADPAVGLRAKDVGAVAAIVLAAATGAAVFYEALQRGLLGLGI